MHISSLKVRDFVSHSDTDFAALGRVTVLVGPNGSGKSSLFEAIRTLSRLLTCPVNQSFGPPPHSFEDKLFRGANQKAMRFEAQLNDPAYPTTVTYHIEIGYTGREIVGSPPSILAETVKLDDELMFDRASRILRVPGLQADIISPGVSLLATIRSLSRNADIPIPVVLASMARKAGSVVRYRLEPGELSRPSQEPDFDSPMRLGYEGENLAACLFWLSKNYPDILDSIVAEMQKVAAALRGIDFNYVGVDRVGFVFEYDDSRHRVLAANASSGTLLLLGLVTLLKWPTRPAIACIEEPETGLTPDAVRLFFKLLCDTASITDTMKRTQFLFSSHSPFVLVDAWNLLSDDRSFIKRLSVDNGRTHVDDIQSIIERGDSGAVLQKDKSGRAILGLKSAEELMCGRFLP